MENTIKNPLLNTFDVQHLAVPFDLIKTEHYLPAIQESLTRAKAEIEEIKTNSQTANFENTIVALEVSGQTLGRATEVFFNLLGADGNDDMQKLAQEISPLLSEYSNDINLDEKLFERVKTVYENQKSESLNIEQIQLLEDTYSGFARNGALLSLEDKQKLRDIDGELAKLSPTFSENLLKATNKFELLVESKEDVEGIPESAVAGAAEKAKQSGKDGNWIFTLQAPSSGPFISYCKNRSLREKMSRASGSRAYKDEFDNSEIIKKIAVLYTQRAQLLGFKNHAEYTLKKRMAESAEKVKAFQDDLLKVAKPAAEKEFQALTEFAKKTDNIDELKPWDIAYYMEKLKKQNFDFDEEKLRPYFKLENVIDGAFQCAQKLYGLEFKESDKYPKYHKDVSVYEAFNQDTGDFIGLFYTDFFPRETKRGGAWMTTFLSQGLFAGEVRRPHVSIVCNFTPSTAEKPSLLTYNEVRTLFHEFGHALHGLVSDCTYQSMASPNVYWDFVELPSQIMENWTLEKEGLALFAKHYETGEMIPEELIKKLKQSSQFMAGYFNVRQLSLSYLDMAWFTNDNPESITDVEAFENQAKQLTQLIPPTEGFNISCAFGHIFGGGYSAGYYSYKWAEVLDADAFEAFKEKGIFDKQIATSFKDNILSRGGSEHPMDLYKKFRGREPDAKALLRRDGLI